MKIQSAKVFVCSPDRNFVTLRIETHAGVYGLGDATLNGRELAVAAYLEEHVLPCLIGVFNSLWDAKELIERQWIDYIRMTIVHGGGISHARKVADLAAIYGVRTGYHGATDLSPVAMAAALHLGLAVHNFGIQEHMPHTALTDEVFPHGYGFKTGFMHPGDKPGLGVEFDEKLAAKHPYQRAYLPIARKFDGTLTDW